MNDLFEVYLEREILAVPDLLRVSSHFVVDSQTEKTDRKLCSCED